MPQLGTATRLRDSITKDMAIGDALAPSDPVRTKLDELIRQRARKLVVAEAYPRPVWLFWLVAVYFILGWLFLAGYQGDINEAAYGWAMSGLLVLAVAWLAWDGWVDLRRRQLDKQLR